MENKTTELTREVLLTRQHITEKRRINVPDKVIQACGECNGPLTNVRVVLEIITAEKNHHLELAGYGDCTKCGEGQDSFGWEEVL